MRRHTNADIDAIGAGQSDGTHDDKFLTLICEVCYEEKSRKAKQTRFEESRVADRSRSVVGCGPTGQAYVTI